MLLSIVSGLGHMYLRHYVLGAALFALFAASLDGIFLGMTIQARPTLARVLLFVCSPLAVGVWAAGLVHAWRLSYGTDRKTLHAERVRLFNEGLVLYLRDDLESARDRFHHAVTADVDWDDPDPLFYLGITELRLAERRAARGEIDAAARPRRRGLKALAACLRRDDKRKWRAEVELERARVRRLTAAAATVSA
jgi:hypothetical protein